MKQYFQKDYLDKLGTCNNTIKSHGCFITSLGMLAEIEPPEVNQILKDNGGYSQGCLVNSEKAAELLGLEYHGRTTIVPNYDCIAETDYYKSLGVPQHFFIHLTNGNIIDPLTGKESKNKYKIISYRLFKKGNEMTQEQIADILARVWLKLNGKNPNMDSINREAQDAKKRLEGGERYAVNSYIDKYFSEVPQKNCQEYIDKINKARKDLE